ncbi:alpha/beta fold hydrolase [Polaromonas sp.]|uniref:alpha/beta fold hydrolase n=1 Tax=Polaromonas sp. TaxID=1869339 RepID=UPI0025F30F30|nr:alpha/beta fold hydrolase [Polaromonas sp.]
MKKPLLHWTKQGQGPVVVLSHALGCDLGMWDGVAAILQTRYTVLRYDQRGHGQSEVVPGPYTMGLLAKDATELIRAQAPGAVHFVGLSMGAMVAQLLAASQPQLLKSVVIANAANHYDDAARALWQARISLVRTQGVAAIADGAMQRWFTPEFRADQAGGGAQRVASLRLQLEKTDAAAYAASCQAVAGIDFRASNAHIACPALVIAGTRDEATPLALSQAIVDSITGAQLRTLEAAHLSAVEQPQAFARLLESFFDSVETVTP